MKPSCENVFDIAIVGMACRFPGEANTPDEFLKFLLNSGNGIVDVPKDRWLSDAYYDKDKERFDKLYVNRGGFIKNIDLFDPLFFGISPKEAPYIDPQHRWLLELCYEAFENAGITPSSLKGSDTSVFIGQFMHDYEQLQLDASAHKGMSSHTATGPSMTLTANRISYVFDLRGASVALDTACSSSLVALDMACNSILKGDSKIGVAGGVNILLRPELTMSICAASMLSPDGYCKSFDESANGYVRSEGAGIVVVKSLRDAIDDNDPILAVIKATSVNQDGQTPGITVPNGDSQHALLKKSFAKSGLHPASIQYAEAHGTGTAVGDPIEVNAIGTVLAEGRKENCFLGSVKSNIGHMEATAGVAGIIKTVLSMNAGVIPGNLHFQKVNPKIDLESLNLSVVSNNTEWPQMEGGKRRAIVNSFGFGGTNANCILEEAPPCVYEVFNQKPIIFSEYKILPISAKSPESLKGIVQNYKIFIEEAINKSVVNKATHDADSHALLHNICYTASAKRDHYRNRIAILGKSLDEMLESMNSWLAGESEGLIEEGELPSDYSSSPPRICFVLSGMGTQWHGAAKELYNIEPAFKREMDEIDSALREYTGWSLLQKLFDQSALEEINNTEVAQPVIFAVQVGLSRLLESWGVVPEFLVGHSAGEVAAAYLSGTLDFEQSILVLYHRSRLQQTLDGTGKMLAVGLSEKEIVGYIGSFTRVSIAAINSESAITLSGDEESLNKVASKLDEDGVFNRFLNVNVPYHSFVMDEIKDELLSVLATLKPAVSSIPLYSTVTGEQVIAQDWDAHYWFRNVREPVRFMKAVDAISTAGANVYIEVSPHSVLLSSVKSIVGNKKSALFVPTLKKNLNSEIQALSFLARLYAGGRLPPWINFYPERGKPVQLPNYVWLRDRYWSESSDVNHARLNNTGGGTVFSPGQYPLLGGALDSESYLWRIQLDLKDYDYLSGHKADGEILFPGAAYVEIGLSIAHSLERQGPDARAIEILDINFLKPLYIQESRPRILESGYDRSSGRYEIRSRIEDEKKWEVFSNGLISERPISGEEVDKVDYDGLLKRFNAELVHAEAFYEHCNLLGLHYSGAFKLINWVVSNDCGESLSSLDVSEQLISDDNKYILHPAILDCAFQTFFATVKSSFLPSSIKSIRVYKLPVKKLYCHYKTLENENGRILGDILVFDESGSVYVEVLGIEVLAFQSNKHASNPLQYLYDDTWINKALKNDTSVEVENLCVLYEEKSNWLDELCDALTSAGVVVSTEELALLKAGSDKQLDGHPLPSGLAKADSVLCFLSSSTREGLMVFDESMHKAMEVLGLAKCLYLEELNPIVKLVVVSSEFNGFGGDQGGEMACIHSACRGFFKVFQNEKPELDIKLIGFDLNTIDINALARECIRGFDEREVRLSGSERYVNRLTSIDSKKLERYSADTWIVGDGQNCANYSIDVLGNISEKEALCIKQFSNKPLNDEIEVRTKAVLPYRAIGNTGTIEGWNVVSASASEDGTTQRAGLCLVKGDPKSGYCLKSNRFFSLDENNHHHALLMLVIPAILSNKIRTILYSDESVQSIYIHCDDGTVFSQILASILLDEGCSVYLGVKDKRRFEKNKAYGLPGLAVIEHKGARICRYDLDANIDAIVGNPDLKLPDFVLGAFGTAKQVISIVGENIGSVPGLSRQWVNSARHQVYVSQVLSHFSLAGDWESLNLNKLEKLMSSRSVETQQFASNKPGNLASGNARIIDFSSQPEKLHAGYLTDAIEGNGAYLVTGGLGALGLEVMDWLSQNGAGYIVLMGRNSPSSVAQRRIEDVRSRGTQVETFKGDVCALVDVQNAIEFVSRSHFSFNGIFHSAGVLDDGVISNQSAEKFYKVLRPKIEGTWNLHLSTLNLDLRAFVCFSSIAATVGWVGQSNYAFANSFMDGLVRHRRNRGLAGLSINWGPWKSAGMAANLSEQDKKRMANSGLAELEAQDALDSMQILINHQLVQAGVFDVDWTKFANGLSQVDVPAYYEKLISKEARDEAGFSDKYFNSSNDIQESILAIEIKKAIAQVVGLSPDADLDLDKDIFELGINSLMAMEIKNTIQGAIQSKLPASLVNANPTVRKMVGYLQGVLDQSEQNNSRNQVAEYIGPVKLTAEQQNFMSWLKINSQWAITNHYFEAQIAYDPEKLNQAINHVTKVHESLRARFFKNDEGWASELVAYSPYQAVTVLDWFGLSRRDVLVALKEYAEKQSINHKLASDPIVRVALVNFGDEGRQIVLFSLHHYSLDGYSIYLLTEDIKKAYQQLDSGSEISLPPSTTSVRQWIAALSEFASTPDLLKEAEYWKSLPLASSCDIPLDFPGNQEKRYIKTHARVERALGKGLSHQVMTTIPSSLKINSFNVYLSALYLLVKDWKKDSELSFGAVDNGRSLLQGNSNIDLSRTIGWLSILKVIHLALPEEKQTFSNIVRAIQDIRESLPNEGANLELLSAYSNDDLIRQELRSLARPRIWLNYSGNPLRNDKLGVRELEGYNWVNKENQLPWYFLISINEVNGVVHIYWDYSVSVHKKETVEKLADQFNELVGSLTDSLLNKQDVLEEFGES